MSAPCSFSERPKAKMPPSAIAVGGLLPHLLVRAHPERPEAEDRDLPRVPVAEAVEAEDLVDVAVAERVPPGVGAAQLRGGEEVGEDLLPLHEVEEVGVPDPVEVVLAELPLSLRLEELDRLRHDLARAGVEGELTEPLRVQQEHGVLRGSRLPSRALRRTAGPRRRSAPEDSTCPIPPRSSSPHATS